MLVLLTVLLGCFAMNLGSCCNVVLLCLEVFQVSSCTHKIVMGVSRSGGCPLHLLFGKQTLLY